jgi:hypothetical protein
MGKMTGNHVQDSAPKKNLLLKGLRKERNMYSESELRTSTDSLNLSRENQPLRSHRLMLQMHPMHLKSCRTAQHLLLFNGLPHSMQEANQSLDIILRSAIEVEIG